MKKIGMPTLFVFSVALALVVMTGQPARADAPLKTVTGTVVSIDGDILTLRTPTGDMSFDMDKDTERPAGGFAVNSQVTVWYDSDDDLADEPDARRITMVPATSSPPASVTTETTREIDISQDVRKQETAQQQEVVSQQEGTELPATAGPLPLLAGAGFLALAGGAILRKRSRRA